MHFSLRESIGNMKDRIAEFILGTKVSNIGENVIIAPCWSPNSVGIVNTDLISEATCNIWRCSIEDVTFNYIVCGVGACLCADIVLALKATSCKRILFLGSAGALTPNIKIGDFIIPQAVICGEGASRYTAGRIQEDLFGKSFDIQESISRYLYEECKQATEKNGVSCHYGIGISVESIYSQYECMEQICALGCNCIDMESSAFLIAANKNSFDSGICFCISDNVTDGKPLMDVEDGLVEFRKAIRKKVMPSVLHSFFAMN